jgi:uncharacterized protein (DUF849 family)
VIDPNPVVVAVAPNGARRGKADHPALPVTATEIAATAAACRDAGASLLHLHVRDRAAAHTLDVDAYRTAIAAVREAVGDDLIIQATSEAIGRYDAAAQMAMVRALRPEAVSLAVRELIPDPAAEATTADFLAWLDRERIRAQYILYSDAEVRRFADLHRRGIIPDAHPLVLFVLGRYGPADASRPRDLLPFLAAWDAAGAPGLWGACAFGAGEGACAVAAAALGGHPRVGFENNLLLADGRTAADNAALVRQLVDALPVLGLRPASAVEARRLFGTS